MEWQGFALVIGACFASAFYQVTNKKLLVKAAPADCVSTVNFLGGGALLLAVSLLWNPPQVADWVSWPGGLAWPLVATALLNIIILFGNVRALKYGDASLIQPIGATQPLLVLVPSMLILGETPNRWGYTGLALLALGTYFINFGEEVKGWECPAWLRWMGRRARYMAPWQMLLKNRGVKIALVVAACGAVSVNFDKLTTARADSFIFPPALILLFCGVVGLVKTVATNEWLKVTREHRANLISNPFIYAVTLIGFWLAFKYGNAAYVGALKRFNVPVTLFLAWLILREQNVKKRWPGAALMAIGAALLSIK